MNLPTQAQVLAATPHAASFAAGAIAILGLSSKIDPAQVTALINSLGVFVNDGILIIGAATPLIAGYLASRSASPIQQRLAVAADPETKKIITSAAAAAATPSDKVVSK